MPHYTPLIATIVAGLVLAFIFGAIANRLKLSPLVGYLVAGVMVSPHTPGFAADQALANELAEIGVILLMFGVGLHFSLKELLSVKAIAIPGAIVQIGIATLMGLGLTTVLGWPIGGGLVFGLALSVASTVVLVRALQERRLIESERGHIAVGWLIVEDLAMVLALVLLPALAPLFKENTTIILGSDRTTELMFAIGMTLAKVAGFVAFMLIVGKRVVPWILHYVAHTGSRELFRLCVLAIALGIAYGAALLFDVSFALGAFFAGMIMSESELSQQAAEETLPLRDAFAVLFFVSVGMLVDPTIVVREPLPLLATVFIILIGKSLASFLIVIAFRHPVAVALTISASLAQIGEFSFILANLGVELELLPERGRDLILAGAILSILANPLFFEAIDRLKPWIERRWPAMAPATPEPEPDAEIPVTHLTSHAVIVGFGRVGSVVGERLIAEGWSILVIEDNETTVKNLRAQGVEVIAGNAANPEVLRAANLEGARVLFVAVPNAFEAGQIIEQARGTDPILRIIARAHFDAEVDYLKQLGANVIIMGEREIARAMLESVLGADGATAPGPHPSTSSG